MRGSLFDIEEFAVYDGPGIRSVVFLKGCPLRCPWCHNPEGLCPGPQRVTSVGLCAHCGACDAVCPSPQRCLGCGRCEAACPKGCVHVAGRPVEAQAVARRVLANGELLRLNGGGVTFSGGEPLLQPDFLLELRQEMASLHACVETSGYAKEEDFRRVAQAMDLVILDVKLADPLGHRRYTGVDNGPILANLRWLKESGKPFRIRVPLIPTLTDSLENLQATARLLAGAKALEKVELLPYHKAAGAKYASVGLAYRPPFPVDHPPQIHTQPFTDLGMEVTVL
ncbi:MAG: glycyl-radical enzyme activating protein [Candidatus Limiplasma sp.]|nr:glycyl-radical enzyme activating protein [Candidatus Limiplasma sp.]